MSGDQQLMLLCQWLYGAEQIGRVGFLLLGVWEQLSLPLGHCFGIADILQHRLINARRYHFASGPRCSIIHHPTQDKHYITPECVSAAEHFLKVLVYSLATIHLLLPFCPNKVLIWGVSWQLVVLGSSHKDLGGWNIHGFPFSNTC